MRSARSKARTYIVIYYHAKLSTRVSLMKLGTRVSLIRRLVGTTWGAGASVLRTVTLALVYSTAEYSTPVWCRSAHTRLIDPFIYNAVRVVTGCLLPTPTDYLTVLAGIPPAELRRRQATLTLARRALEPNHLHHKIISPEQRQSRRLKLRHPFYARRQRTTIQSQPSGH